MIALLGKGAIDHTADVSAVKNKQGQIIARAKLSILWDGEKPTLYLEKMYSQSKFTNRCLKAIAEMAIAKAQSLGIPLAVEKGSSYCNLLPVPGADSEKPLLSLGGGVSYEYVDACTGVQKDGIFEIPAASIAIIA